METRMTELKANGTCGFCGEACNADMQGAKAYDCEDFPMALTGAMSYGAWGACPTCAALIDSENWDALEKHMTAIQRHRFGFLAELMLPRLRQTHVQQVELFRQHRTLAPEIAGTGSVVEIRSTKDKTMKITTLWLGVKILEDGKPSDAMQDWYVALQHAEWMTLTDCNGFPRPTEPGDIFWLPTPVLGVDVSLHNGRLVATDGTTEVKLEGVALSSILPGAEFLVSALIDMLWQPPDKVPGLRGHFGTGGYDAD
jgi:hypothetical protein